MNNEHSYTARFYKDGCIDSKIDMVKPDILCAIKYAETLGKEKQCNTVLVECVDADREFDYQVKITLK